MFDFSKVSAPAKLNKEFILNHVTDSMLWYFYYGPFKIGDVYLSRIKPEKSPSAGFYISSSGKIIYNHLNDKVPKLDVFAYVAQLYGLNFNDTIKRIAMDFGLISGEPSKNANKAMVAMQDFDTQQKKETKIHFTAFSWNSETLAYWKDYHIEKDELKKAGIYPIKTLFLNERKVSNKENIQRFALTLMDGDDMLVKVYAPGAQDSSKWLSNIPLDMPFGFNELPKNESYSFGAKAQKDRLILLKFIPAVYALQNESRGSFTSKDIKKLKFWFIKNFIGADNDETGLKFMNAMVAENFIPAYVPEHLNETEGIKDWADLSKAHGLDFVEALLKDYKII